MRRVGVFVLFPETKKPETPLPEFLANDPNPSLEAIFQNYSDFKTVSASRQKLILAPLLGPLLKNSISSKILDEVVNRLLDTQ